MLPLHRTVTGLFCDNLRPHRSGAESVTLPRVQPGAKSRHIQKQRLFGYSRGIRGSADARGRHSRHNQSGNEGHLKHIVAKRQSYALNHRELSLKAYLCRAESIMLPLHRTVTGLFCDNLRRIVSGAESVTLPRVQPGAKSRHIQKQRLFGYSRGIRGSADARVGIHDTINREMKVI